MFSEICTACDLLVQAIAITTHDLWHFVQSVGTVEKPIPASRWPNLGLTIFPYPQFIQLWQAHLYWLAAATNKIIFLVAYKRAL